MDSATSISLKEAITELLKNNSSLQLSRLNEKIAAANFKQTDAIFMPSIGFSYTVLNTNNSLNAFGFKLQEQSIQQNDFNPQTLNHPGSSSDFTTRL